MRNITVSSQEHNARFELPNGIWQSCGSQGEVSEKVINYTCYNGKEKSLYFVSTLLFQHWIRLEMYSDIIVKSLKMGVDPADNSYMPSVIIVSGGSSVSSLTELNVVYVRNIDTIVTLLSNMEQV